MRKGYYFKIGKDQALAVVKVIAHDYGVEPPNIRVERLDCNACYYWQTKTIGMWARNHLKSIFHEFYHHLENVTNGHYNSDDKEGGDSSYGWIFADKLWDLFHRYVITYSENIDM